MLLFVAIVFLILAPEPIVAQDVCSILFTNDCDSSINLTDPISATWDFNIEVRNRENLAQTLDIDFTFAYDRQSYLPNITDVQLQDIDDILALASDLIAAANTYTYISISYPDVETAAAESQEYLDFTERSWRDSPPDGIDVNLIPDTCVLTQRSVEQVADGQECKTVRTDNGDGTFSERRDCVTRYREEPVYDDWCEFTGKRLETAALTSVPNPLEFEGKIIDGMGYINVDHLAWTTNETTMLFGWYGADLLELLFQASLFSGFIDFEIPDETSIVQSMIADLNIALWMDTVQKDNVILENQPVAVFESRLSVEDAIAGNRTNMLILNLLLSEVFPEGIDIMDASFTDNFDLTITEYIGLDSKYLEQIELELYTSNIVVNAIINISDVNKPSTLLDIPDARIISTMDLISIVSTGDISSILTPAISSNRIEDLELSVSDDTTPVQFTIEQGDNIYTIGQNLYANNLIVDTQLFVDYVLLEAETEQPFLSGVYYISPSMTIPEIFQALYTAPDSSTIILILPGVRLEEIASLIDANPLVPFSGSEFLDIAVTDLAFSSQSRSLLNMPSFASTEGFMLQGTYEISSTTTATEFRDEVVGNWGETYMTQYGRFPMNGLTVYEAVILASIVERETLWEEDMPFVASVYLNRLEIDMQLMSDATVQYALNGERGMWWPALTVNDYRSVVSSYNTYLNTGLPPGPISSPSIAAIEAVVLGEKTDYYYFRASCDGSGRLVFFETYDELLQGGC